MGPMTAWCPDHSVASDFDFLIPFRMIGIQWKVGIGFAESRWGGYHYDRHLLPSDGRSVIGDGSISETTKVSDGSDQCGDLENLKMENWNWCNMEWYIPTDAYW